MFKQPRTDAATRSDLHGVFCMANQMQGTPNPACKMRLGRGQAGKGVVGRAPDKLVVDGFWGRTGSVPTTPPPPTCVRCLPVMGGAARGVERRDDRRKTSKGPLGCPSKKDGKATSACAGVWRWPRARPFPGGTRPHSRDPRIPHTISLALLPWPCNIVRIQRVLVALREGELGSLREHVEQGAQ
jgi:hypothetical protein